MEYHIPVSMISTRKRAYISDLEEPTSAVRLNICFVLLTNDPGCADPGAESGDAAYETWGISVDVSWSDGAGMGFSEIGRGEWELSAECSVSISIVTEEDMLPAVATTSRVTSARETLAMPEFEWCGVGPPEIEISVHANVTAPSAAVYCSIWKIQ